MQLVHFRGLDCLESPTQSSARFVQCSEFANRAIFQYLLHHKVLNAAFELLPMGRFVKYEFMDMIIARRLLIPYLSSMNHSFILRSWSGEKNP